MSSQIQQQQAVPDTTGSWSIDLPFCQFAPSLGTLNQVNVGLVADLDGAVAIENLQSAAAPFSVAQYADVTLGDGTGAVLTGDGAGGSQDLTLGGYDGVTDYAGTSGTQVSLSGSLTTEATLSSIGAFIGDGTLNLPLSAAPTLEVSGPDNMEIASGAAVGATATLGYTYQPASSGSGSGFEYDDSGSGNLAPGNGGAYLSGFNSVSTPTQTFNIADSQVGWANTIAAQQFDPALGTLESVHITLTGDIYASVGAENLGNVAGAVTTAQAAHIALTLPGVPVRDGNLLDMPIVAKDTIELGSYDGSADFSGSSGRLDTGISQSSSVSVDLIGTDVAAFLGTGTVDLPISALGSAAAAGPANLLLSLLADAGATVTVSYSYLPADPVWSTPDVAITTPGIYTLSNEPDVDWSSGQPIMVNSGSIGSVLIDAPGATLVVGSPLGVTGAFVLEAGTVVFEDGGTLSVGSYKQTGGVVQGRTVDIVAAAGFAETGGSIEADTTVDLTAGTTMTVGSIAGAHVVLNTPAGVTGPRTGVTTGVTTTGSIAVSATLPAATAVLPASLVAASIPQTPTAQVLTSASTTLLLAPLDITVSAGGVTVENALTGETLQTPPAISSNSMQFLSLHGVQYGLNLTSAESLGLVPGQLRDYDGNDLGAAGSWQMIGLAAVRDGATPSYILDNPSNGRWAEVAVQSHGTFNFANHGVGGDTRVVGIYIDPMVQSGQVVAGGPDDSQLRFLSDVKADRLAVLGSTPDPTAPRFEDVFFKLTNHAADHHDDVYLRAILWGDGNIEYANYMNTSQFTQWMANAGVSSSVYADWLTKL